MIEVLKQMVDALDYVGYAYVTCEEQAQADAAKQAGLDAIVKLESQEPFGIWHQGATDEESDFYLYSESGDVSCPTCIKLYTTPLQRTEPVAILNHAHGVHTFRNVNLKGLPDGEYLVYTYPPQRTEQEPVAWEHLKAYGYAPGGYMMTCRGCNKQVIDVDKRASRCRTCAETAYAKDTHPPQRTEPLIGCVNHDCAKCKELESQEPVGFAGIEMWIGNTRIKKLMTQTELHSAIDPWAIVEFNSDSCIDALKEKNT